MGKAKKPVNQSELTGLALLLEPLAALSVS